jgi:hypothetical protein
MTPLASTAAVALLGWFSLMLPAQASPSEAHGVLSQSGAVQRAIADLQRLENDFFNLGRLRFEAEVERLLQAQDEPDTPLLTIDDAIWVTPEAIDPPEAQQMP